MESPNGSVITRDGLPIDVLDKVVRVMTHPGRTGPHVRRRVEFSNDISKVCAVGIFFHNDEDSSRGIPPKRYCLKDDPIHRNYEVTWFSINQALGEQYVPIPQVDNSGDERWFRCTPCCQSAQTAGWTFCLSCQLDLIFYDDEGKACVPARGFHLHQKILPPRWHLAEQVKERIISPQRIEIVEAWYFQTYGHDLWPTKVKQDADVHASSADIDDDAPASGAEPSSGVMAAAGEATPRPSTRDIKIEGFDESKISEDCTKHRRRGVRGAESSFRRDYTYYLKRLCAYEGRIYALLEEKNKAFDSWFVLGDHLEVIYAEGSPSARSLNAVDMAMKGIDPALGFNDNIFWKPWSASGPTPEDDEHYLCAGWLPVDSWCELHPELDAIADPAEFCIASWQRGLYDPTVAIRNVPITCYVVAQWAFRSVLRYEYGVEGAIEVNEAWLMQYFPFKRPSLKWDPASFKQEIKGVASSPAPSHQVSNDNITELCKDLDQMFAKESGRSLEELGITSWSQSACSAAERAHALRNIHREKEPVRTSTHLPAKRSHAEIASSSAGPN